MIKCKKTHYTSKKYAKLAALLVKSSKKLKAYKCKECSGYHITGYTAKQTASFKDARLIINN